MDVTTRAELDEEARRIRDEVLRIVSEIRRVLSEDLPAFVERETKNAFVEHPAFAASINDAQLREIKRDVRARAALGCREIMEAIEDPDVWIVSLEADATPRSLADNEVLWARVQTVADVVRSLEADHGFPQRKSAVEYHPPTWFIAGKYLPTLTEKYWSRLSALSEVRRRTAVVDEVNARTAARRWDEA